MTSRMKLSVTAWVFVVVPTAILLQAYRSLRDDMHTEVAALRQQLADLKAVQPFAGGAPEQRLAAEVARLRTQLLELRSALTTTQPIQPSIASAATSSPPETLATQELGLRLEQTLHSEPQTLEARRLADTLGASILRALPQRASLLQIACVASLCRVEISYASAEQLQSFVETQLPGTDNGFWPGPVYLQLLSNPPPAQGEVRALLYLGRGAAGFDFKQDG